jgi:hypothetical protein
LTRRIFGSSLAALVSVAELSTTENVTWVQNSKLVGGHFSGLTFGNLKLDLGMVAQEPYSGLTSVDAFTDRPPIRQDGLPFVRVANQWLAQRGEEFVELPVLVSLYGKVMPDYLIADSLEVLQKIDETLKRKISGEILALKETEKYSDTTHPRDKGCSEDYLRLSFEVISVQLFGKTFHENLIAPWLDRLNPHIAASLPARDHRTAWVPLYYPETILGVISNQMLPSEIQRPFRVPKNSSIAMVVARLIASIDISKVEIVLDETAIISPSSGDILLTSTSETFALLKRRFSPNYAEKFIAPIVLAFFQYDRWVADEKIVNIIEKEIGPYRICVRNITDKHLRTNISIEFGSQFEGATEDEILHKSREALRLIDVGTNFARFIIKRISINVPYGESRFEIENDAKLANETIREHQLHGYPIGFGSSTLNDQILLGLWSANAARSQKSEN